MAYTSCFGLFRIASNPDVQQKMFNELRELLPNKEDDVTDSVLKRAVYAKAVLQEIFRINPASVGVGRVLPKPCVLSGYNVPAGTIVVTQHQVTCRLPKYFSRPDGFHPERWLKTSPQYEQPCSPYIVQPFSHGPRSCIARRLATQSLLIVLIKFVRNYKMYWMGSDDLESVFVLINKPDGPVPIRFEPRDSGPRMISKPTVETDYPTSSK